MATAVRVLPRFAARHHRLPLRSRRGCYVRFLSASSAQDDAEKKEEPVKASTELPSVGSLPEATLRGVGQVIFLNSPTCGLAILGGLAIGNPYLSVLAATGAATATATAHSVGMDKAAIQDGLLGYNGCLVGCAAAVFVNPLPAASVLSPVALTAATAGMATTVMGAAATPFVAAALKPAMGSVPQWTIAFNMVTLSILIRTRPLLEDSELATATASASDVATATETATTTTTTSLSDVLIHAPWTGISQIFVVESTLAGAAILGGIAYYSRGLAAHTLLGSSIGAATGALMGAAGDFSSLAAGLYGFNSALTSLGVGVFYVHSPQVMALSAGGALATSVVFGAMVEMSGVYGTPCLTLPFCLTMSGCYLMADAVPGLRLATAPHSPEQNE